MIQIIVASLRTAEINVLVSRYLKHFSTLCLSLWRRRLLENGGFSALALLGFRLSAVHLSPDPGSWGWWLDSNLSADTPPTRNTTAFGLPP